MLRKKSQAILLVITLLGVMLVIGSSVLLLSMNDLKHSRVFLQSQKARWSAEAGLVYARKLLDLDNENKSDSFYDMHFLLSKGDDTDCNEDGTNEAKRFAITDSKNKEFGAFSLCIQDEAGKLNLNSFLNDFNEQDFSYVSSLAGFSIQDGFSQYLKGADGSAGELAIDDDCNNALFERDGQDNDRDGFIDEINEGVDDPYEIGYGDDNVFVVPEEALRFIDGASDKRFRDYFTVFSKEEEKDLFSKPRSAFRLARLRDLLAIFLNSGVSYDKALNFYDAADVDFKQSLADIFYKKITLTPPTGGSYKLISGFYQANAGSASSDWMLNVSDLEDGDYYIFFYGKSGEPVGRVIIEDQQTEESVYSGEGLSQKISVSGGKVLFSIVPDEEKESYLNNIELVDLSKKNGLNQKKIRGVEALRINELMINPSEYISVDQNQSPGGDWTWQSGHYQSLPSGGRGQWIFEVNRSGYFYLRFSAQNEGDLIGNVRVGNQSLTAYDGSWTNEPVFIHGSVVVYIENTSITAQSTFSGIEITQEPDAEYIELLNMSDEDIDLGGFSFDIEREAGSVLGWPAAIPEGTSIAAHEHLVFAVDATDSTCPDFLRSNSLSFKRIWGEDAIQLQFNNSVEGNDDIIPDDGAIVYLYDDQGNAVDVVEYDSSLVIPFNSIERGDPALSGDTDNDGFFDSWQLCLDLVKATPNKANKNSSLELIDPISLEVSYKDPSYREVLNRPFRNIADALEVVSSAAWENITERDLAFLVDKFTDNVIYLPLSNSVKESSFQQTENAFFSESVGQQVNFSFDNIDKGSYSLKFYVDDTSLSMVNVKVSSNNADFELGPLSADGSWINFGRIAIGDDGQLLISVINQEDKPFKIHSIILEPRNIIEGRININTAPVEIMNFLFGVNAEKVINNRPYGEKDSRFLGVGDLLTGNILGEDSVSKMNAIEKILSFITTHSDVYEIISIGESNGLQKAKHKIETVVER